MGKQASIASNLSFTSGFRANNSGSQEDGVVCLQNIGPAERRKRLRFGLITLAAGLVLGFLMILTGVDHWWRVILFLPLAGGATGFFQSREKT